MQGGTCLSLFILDCSVEPSVNRQFIRVHRERGNGLTRNTDANSEKY